MTVLALVAGLLYAAYAGLNVRSQPPALRSIQVDVGTVDASVRATGSVSSVRDLRVAASQGGRADEVFVSVGSQVARGQRLLRINSDDAALQLAADEVAITEVQTAIAQQERSLALLRQDVQAGAEPREKVTQAEERLQLDRLRLRRAEAQARVWRFRIAESVVIAPMAGQVTALDIGPGEMVRPGNPLVTLIDSSKLEILARMEQADAHAIRPGMVARVSLDGAPEKAVEERVLRIEPALRREGTADFLAVWISLTPSPLVLRPNQQVDVRLPIGTRTAVTRLPLQALVSSGGKSSVWVAEAGRLRALQIQIGTIGDRHVEVKSGLQAGQVVLLLDGKTLKEGDAVSVADAKP